MYVCICQAVTDHAIRDEVRAGARTMKDLQQRLGVARCCGRCAPCACEVLTASLHELQPEPLPGAAAPPPALATANTT